MKLKTKELILKIDIALGGIMMLLFVIFLIAEVLFTAIGLEKVAEILCYPMIIFFILWMLFGVILMLLTFLFSSNKKDSLKRGVNKDYEIYKTRYSTYKGMLVYLDKAFKKEKYELKVNKKFDNGMEMYIYARSRKWGNLDIISVITTNNFKEEDEEVIDNEMNEFFENYNPYYTYFIPIVITTNKTSFFEEYMSNEVIQDEFRFYLPVGILLNERKILLARQRNEIGIVKYWELRSHFLNLIEIPKDVQKANLKTLKQYRKEKKQMGK